ncbi:hypothetical protein [Agathobaculum hominis]|uniref:hypothetical protein n=1 Tax=Agathobaculum hominis TaxID=2763014 RepID=UPI001FACD9C1|nr:hypothetical protein [Agathobaculum hominis]
MGGRWLSAAQLNNLSKEDLAAMVLQMQKQINSLNEQVSVMNARLFGRSTEKLKTLPGQICCGTALPRRHW